MLFAFLRFQMKAISSSSTHVPHTPSMSSPFLLALYLLAFTGLKSHSLSLNNHRWSSHSVTLGGTQTTPQVTTLTHPPLHATAKVEPQSLYARDCFNIADYFHIEMGFCWSLASTPGSYLNSLGPFHKQIQCKNLSTKKTRWLRTIQGFPIPFPIVIVQLSLIAITRFAPSRLFHQYFSN